MGNLPDMFLTIQKSTALRRIIAEKVKTESSIIAFKKNSLRLLNYFIP